MILCSPHWCSCFGGGFLFRTIWTSWRW